MAAKQRGLLFNEVDEFRDVSTLLDFLLQWNDDFDEINNNKPSYGGMSRTSQAREATDEDWDRIFPL